MIIRLGDEEIERVLEHWRQTGMALAKAESEYESLNSTKKVKFAEAFLNSNGKTAREKECEAEISVSSFIALIRKQKKMIIELRQELSRIQTNCDLYRTTQANVRGEIKGLTSLN